MQISGNYTGFPEKTLVVILNHEKARFFSAYQYDFLEEEPLLASGDTLEDDQLRSFFSEIHTRMEDALKKNDACAFLVCVPEVHRPLFQEATPKHLAQNIEHIVPKNLSAMDEGPIIRILFEG